MSLDPVTPSIPPLRYIARALQPCWAIWYLERYRSCYQTSGRMCEATCLQPLEEVLNGRDASMMGSLTPSSQCVYIEGCKVLSSWLSHTFSLSVKFSWYRHSTAGVPEQDAFLSRLYYRFHLLRHHPRYQQCRRRYRLDHSWLVMLQELLLLVGQGTRRQASTIMRCSR
jgi:hypothetical protein